MDMMRPQIMAMPPITPDGLAFNVATGELTWNDNSITETEFVIQRTFDGANWVDVGNIISPLDQPNIHQARTFTDASYNSLVVAYRVLALNTVGYGEAYPSVTVKSVSLPLLVNTVMFYYLPLILK
jgi:hypothetical protein